MFMLGISLFKYSRKNFLDWFLNLPRGMTCLQNIFFYVDFLIYIFQIFLWNLCPTANSYFDWYFYLSLCWVLTAPEVSEEEGSYASGFYRWFWESF